MNAPTASPLAIQLTPAAAERVRAQLAQRGQGLGLRLGVRKTGCSGWAYAVDFADQIGADDTVFDQDGVQVVVGQADLPLLAGTVVDYVREGLNAAFRFQNPNVKGECGCGESFTV